MKHIRIRTLAAAGAIAVVSATGGVAAGAVGASASGGVVYSHSTTTKYVYNGRCIHTHTDSTRYEGYSSKAGRYVALVRPSVTHSDSYRCHS